MILRFEVPASDPAFRSGLVSKWYKAEGDAVAFGDDICDIAIDHFMALQRTKRAALLTSTSKLRRRGVRSVYDRREGRGAVHIRLTASEGGVRLGKILAAEGERVDIGQLIGLFTDQDGAVSAGQEEIDAAAVARVVVNMPDASEIDPFED